MNTSMDRIMQLRVSDVMTRDVVKVSVNQTMAEAATALECHEISGAPVIDETGHCVGMLSATEFMHKEGGSDNGEIGSSDVRHRLVCTGSEGTLEIQQIEEDMVRFHMSSAVQSVEANAPLLTAARVMCREHVHRVVVLDEVARPVGVMTSLDLVAALLTSVDEAQTAATATPPDDAEPKARGPYVRMLSEHRDIRESLAGINRMISRRGGNVESLANLVDSLYDHLTVHFQHEEAGGYLREALAHAPRATERAATLQGQHPQLLDLARRLADSARDSDGSAASWQNLEKQAHEFSNRLMEHERGENDLVQSAFTDDIGSKD